MYYELSSDPASGAKVRRKILAGYYRENSWVYFNRLGNSQIQ
jgi:hypothetical protein